jgi:hypothetical protein
LVYFTGPKYLRTGRRFIYLTPFPTGAAESAETGADAAANA